MNVIIFGASGLVGSNLKKILKEKFNWNIFACGSGKKDISINIENIDEFKILSNIIGDQERIDIIINCAVKQNLNLSLKELEKTNVIGAMNIKLFAEKINVKYFIHLSSIQVIGKTSQAIITENDQCVPITNYHKSKLMSEKLVLKKTKTKTKSIVFRIPSPIGKESKNKKIFYKFVNDAKSDKLIHVNGDPQRKQNYLDLRDLAHAIFLVSKYQGHQNLFNIAASKSITDIELAKLIKLVTKSKSVIYEDFQYNKNDNTEWNISIDKARTELKFIPKFSLSDTIIWIS